MRDAGSWKSGLVHKVLNSLTIEGVNDIPDRGLSQGWYLVPRKMVKNIHRSAPHLHCGDDGDHYAEGGFDIHAAVNGYRLDVDESGKSLVMVNSLGDLRCTWDFVRFSTAAAQHRIHFWLPPFLSTPFSNRVDYTELGYGRMRALLSTNKRTADPPAVSLQSAEDCLAACRADSTCVLAAVDQSGNCGLYKGTLTTDVAAKAADSRKPRRNW